MRFKRTHPDGSWDVDGDCCYECDMSGIMGDWCRLGDFAVEEPGELHPDCPLRQGPWSIELVEDD